MLVAPMLDDPLSTGAEPASHPAPSLPRHRGGERPPAEPAELNAAGLTWIHLDSADTLRRGLLAERFGWHPLDVEDVLSKRQRPEGRRLRRRGLPLRRPPLPGLRPGDPAAERGRARRLHRPRLPRHAADRRAAAGHAPLPSLRGGRGVPRAALLEGLRPAALRDRSTTSSTTASRSSTRSATSSTRSRTTSSRAAPRRSSATSRTSSRRSSATARSSSRSARRCACSSAASSGSCRRSSTSTSTTSSTPPSGSGTSSTTTRR